MASTADVAPVLRQASKLASHVRSDQWIALARRSNLRPSDAVIDPVCSSNATTARTWTTDAVSSSKEEGSKTVATSASDRRYPSRKSAKTLPTPIMPTDHNSLA